MDPNTIFEMAKEVSEIFMKLEDEILKDISNEFRKGNELDDESWQIIKYKQISKLRKKWIKNVLKINPQLEATVERLSKEAYDLGISGVDDEVETATEDGAIEPATVSSGQQLIGINEKALMLQAQKLMKEITPVSQGMLRGAEKIYHQIVNDAIAEATAGISTRYEASKKIFYDFAEKGIPALVDKAGRKWSPQTYSEMITRTGLMDTAIEGTKSRMTEYGLDLILTSQHDDESPLCQPWSNRILSIRGQDERYPKLETAIEQGYHHPNCRHYDKVFIPGYTKPNQEIPLEKRNNKYANSQKQRYMERQIRKYKTLENTAFDSKDKKRFARKVYAWEQQLDDFTRKNKTQRKSSREEVFV